MFTEQLTYLDEDVARVSFNKTNYEDLEFYKIKENDKDKIVWQILNVFNETALANLRKHPEEICDAAISGTTFERDGFKEMMNDVENGKVGIVITKDLSRLGRDYLKTGEYVEIIFPDYDVRYIAINDNVDTFKGDNEFMAFKNNFNDWYARDCSKKIRAVFKAKGQSGKHLCPPIYGYRKSLILTRIYG